MSEKETRLKKLPGKKKPPTLTLKIAPEAQTAGKTTNKDKPSRAKKSR